MNRWQEDVQKFTAREPGKAALVAVGGAAGGFLLFYGLGRVLLGTRRSPIVAHAEGAAAPSKVAPPSTDMIPEIVIPTKTVRTPDARRATLRADAKIGAPALEFLTSGTVVTVLSWRVSEGTVWYQIQAPGGIPGWMRGDLLA